MQKLLAARSEFARRFGQQAAEAPALRQQQQQQQQADGPWLFGLPAAAAAASMDVSNASNVNAALLRESYAAALARTNHFSAAEDQLRQRHLYAHVHAWACVHALVLVAARAISSLFSVCA